VQICCKCHHKGRLVHIASADFSHFVLRCPACGVTHRRDDNAGANIRFLGLYAVVNNTNARPPPFDKKLKPATTSGQG